jgi:hypothetical protein
VEAAREVSWRPLGELFVENGLLSEVQLEQALAEQAAMGGRLGDKLVELGFVTRHALARLLAEQTGVEFDVDSGFGTGLLAELQRRKGGLPTPDDFSEPPSDPWTPTIVGSATDAAPQPRRLAQAQAQEARARAMSTFAALEDMWARLAEAESRITELERELRTFAQDRA